MRTVVSSLHAGHGQDRSNYAGRATFIRRRAQDFLTLEPEDWAREVINNMNNWPRGGSEGVTMTSRNELPVSEVERNYDSAQSLLRQIFGGAVRQPFEL